MKVEITHDILAKKIYDRIGAEDKMRLKITEFISDRFLYFQEAGVLLTSKDLHYIEPYLDKVSISKEQTDFIHRSRQEAKNRETRRRITVLTVIATLTLISLLSIISWRNAKAAEIDAKAANKTAAGILLKEAKKDIVHLDHDAAWIKIKVADSLELGDGKTEMVKQVLEIAFFYNEIGHIKKAKERALFADSLLGFPNTPGLKSRDDRLEFREELKKLGQSWEKWIDTLALLTYPKMVYLKGGALEKTDGPIKAFEISPTEVTFWQYAIFCGATLPDSLWQDSIDSAKPGWGIEKDNPVVNVSWYDAARFANWMTKRTQNNTATVYEFITDREKGHYKDSVVTHPDVPGAYRLPRDIEWQFAVKSMGEPDSIILQQGWYDANSAGRTHKVKTAAKAGSKMNIFDLGGNAWEWCEDDGVKGAQLRVRHYGYGKMPNKGTTRVMRGGSWSYLDKITQGDHWHLIFPEAKIDALGFRLVRNPE